MRADLKGKLHEHYSSSAAILQIVKRYGITQAELAKLLGVTKVLITRWVKCNQQIGLKMYREIVHHFPEMDGRIDYGGTYRSNYIKGEDNG